MYSTPTKRNSTLSWTALTLGLAILGLPLEAHAEKAPAIAKGPPAPAAPAAPPVAQAPPPPPNGQQPPPGYAPYPYPPPSGQPGYPPPGYPPPSGQPGYPPPGYPYGYPPNAAYQGGPEVMNYEESQPIPPGYKPEERIRKGLVVGGAVTFGVVYFFTAVGAAYNLDSSRAPYGALFVPVAGPFIVAGAGNFSGVGELGRFGLILDGFVQAGGAAMLLAGIFAKKKVLVRQDVAHVVEPEIMIGPGSAGLKLTF